MKTFHPFFLDGFGELNWGGYWKENFVEKTNKPAKSWKVPARKWRWLQNAWHGRLNTDNKVKFFRNFCDVIMSGEHIFLWKRAIGWKKCLKSFNQRISDVIISSDDVIKRSETSKSSLLLQGGAFFLPSFFLPHVRFICHPFVLFATKIPFENLLVFFATLASVENFQWKCSRLKLAQ